MRRLDRIYLSQSGPGPNWDESSSILPGFAFSDHAPVWADFTIGPAQRRPSCHRMNPSHFSHPVYKERITNIWEAKSARGLRMGWEPARILQGCLKEARIIDRCWGKRLAAERRICLEILQNHLSAAQIALEGDPDNLILQANLIEAREAVNTFNVSQAKWVDSVLQARWIADGDRSTKTFFRQFKGLAAKKEIPELFDT